MDSVGPLSSVFIHQTDLPIQRQRQRESDKLGHRVLGRGRVQDQAHLPAPKTHSTKTLSAVFPKSQFLFWAKFMNVPLILRGKALQLFRILIWSKSNHCPCVTNVKDANTSARRAARYKKQIHGLSVSRGAFALCVCIFPTNLLRLERDTCSCLLRKPVTAWHWAKCWQLTLAVTFLTRRPCCPPAAHPHRSTAAPRSRTAHCGQTHRGQHQPPP